jgi:metal-dependent amidase/aminoacylase/carboxypeptidase family protein
MHPCLRYSHPLDLARAVRDSAVLWGFCARLICQYERYCRTMLDDGLLERFPMGEIYGVHNMPAIPTGHFWTRPGGIMASQDNFVIEIKGRGTHAARPHMGIDPIVVGSDIILALQTVVVANQKRSVSKIGYR